ncbi:MAG: TolC family protein, partial [Candidatus Riflemargulisbacteria bacterium]
NLTIEEETILNQTYQSSLRQYEANRVPQQDPLTMSLMRSEATIKIEQLKEEKRSLLAEATRIIGGEEIQLSFPETLTSNKLLEELSVIQNLATTTGNVDILIASIELIKTNHFKQLANISNLFEYDLGANYDNTMGTFGWMVGLTLPLWANKNTNFMHAQESKADSASANLANITQQVKADVATLFFKIDSAERILPLYKNDLIPKAKQARNLAKTSYQSGQLTLNEWANTEQRYLSINGQYFQLLSERLTAEANINQIIGR